MGEILKPYFLIWFSNVIPPLIVIFDKIFTRFVTDCNYCCFFKNNKNESLVNHTLINFYLRRKGYKGMCLKVLFIEIIYNFLSKIWNGLNNCFEKVCLSLN